MATNRLQVTDLDFDTIKGNLKDFLRGQSEFTDYDFEGSGLNVLLDILAYNTHYNSYYLNMVANESFLDTAVLRDSVVSHAKLLGYTPVSAKSSRAVINLTIPTGDSIPDSLTLPRGFSFKSNIIDNSVYNFVLLNEVSVLKTNENFEFQNLELYEGELVSYTYTYNQDSNPKGIFTIPDTNVDISSIVLTVQASSSNLTSSIYTQSLNITELDSSSEVYFIQEGQNQKYQIYFGTGSIGKALNDGSVITISYLVTSGVNANKANDFVATNPIGLFSQYTIEVVDEASGGAPKETIDNVRINSVSQYASQNRLVTTKDYENYVLTAYPIVESISVWGGEDEIPPIYGKVFISIKPKENYFITELEKERIIEELIKPRAIVSVTTEIRDPDFLFIKLENRVKYDKRKTLYSEDQLKNIIINSIFSYTDLNLNKFSSTLVLSKLQDSIDASDLNSIIGSETILRLEKRFLPQLNEARAYTINFKVPLVRGSLLNRLTSSEFDVFDSSGVLRTAIVEEVPESFTGLSNILITNPGYNYTSTPTVTITGDGTGATAEAKIVNGKLESIRITNRGVNYSKAVISFSGGNGFGAEAIAVLDSRFGTLRTVYFNALAERQIIQRDAGTIDYESGEINLTNIRILSVGSNDGLIRFTVESDSGIISSVRNTIVTIDKTDPSAIITDFIVD
jgi:hypothetical protein